jgi:hypothetical protein
MKVKTVFLLTLLALMEGLLQQHNAAEGNWYGSLKSAFEYIPVKSLHMLQSVDLSK